MAPSNASSPRTAARNETDGQKLADQLAGLLPILERLKAEANDADRPNIQSSLPALDHFIHNPALDQQAAVSFADDIVASSLHTVIDYLQTNSERNPKLQACAASVAQAAQYYAAHDYEAALGLIWPVYREITVERLSNAQLPPIRTITFRQKLACGDKATNGENSARHNDQQFMQHLRTAMHLAGPTKDD